MLNSLRLRNFRSFSDDQENPFINLKPLTIFVGKNSSGKSTFLRSLPLLRQSIEVKTTGPLLWYGSYIDFGAFSEVKKFESESNEVYIDFDLDINYKDLNDIFLFPWDRGRFLREKLQTRIELGVGEVDKKTVLKSLKIYIDDIEYKMLFDSSGKCRLIIDGYEYEDLDNIVYIENDQFLPQIGGVNLRQRKSGDKIEKVKLWDPNYLERFFSEQLDNKLKEIFSAGTGQEKIKKGTSKLDLIYEVDTKRFLKKIFSDQKVFMKKIESCNEVFLKEIYSLCIHKSLARVIRVINKDMEKTLKNIRYIAPLRATAERYYRHQDLQVKEIDHTGSNLAMLLRSLSVKHTGEFTRWTKENFGFKVRVEEDGLHYALKIQTDEDQKEYNINDMGFGFSQILPIVTSIWIEISNKFPDDLHRRDTSKKQLIFAIEQPELHLHPEYQSKLATVFARVIKVAELNNIHLNIIFETHSKTMVDTIGDCIDENIIANDDVNIVLFEKDIKTSSTKVNFATFDNDGDLNNWPIGFFYGR
ncbi:MULTISPECIES: AAA family ATPase [unclassified Pseudoalteromonas]|uniref:AAA family ATPase n=1 Tax=unclassified Pseudoalteromonas TaxID=194690 RepID=UPI0013FD9EFD